MTDRQQTDAFASDLEKLIDRYRCEFDLPAATAVGVLQFQQFLIMNEMLRSCEEGDE